MADNFNLRTFLTENKLTKNAKLLNENADIAQAFSEAGLTGTVTVLFQSDSNMGEPDIYTMPAERALKSIIDKAANAESVLVAQGSEIVKGEQIGDYEEETEGLECKVVIEILDKGVYEIYQDSVETEDTLDEAQFSDSYDTPAAKAVNAKAGEIVGSIRGYSTALQTIQDAIKQVEQEVGSEVTRSEKSTLEKHLLWMFRREMEMERESVENKKTVMEASYKAPSNLKRTVKENLNGYHSEFGQATGTGKEDDTDYLADLAAQSNTFEEFVQGLKRILGPSESNYEGYRSTWNRLKGVNEASYKTSSNSKEAQHLKKGDIIGSGDEVVSVSAGAKTPAGKVEVTLKTKSGSTKVSTWGKTTKVGVKAKETVKENTMTKRDQYLTRLVENALGLNVTEDDNVDYTMGRHDDPDQLPNPAPELNIPEGDEMVQNNTIPEYKTVEELMTQIDKGTNKVAEEHKITEMKRIAKLLREKAQNLEESEHAAHINPKDIKKLNDEAIKLDKAAAKFQAAYEKTYNKKGKAPAPKADNIEKPEALQETTMKNFDLRKFLVENKLTAGSRIINENVNIEQAFTQAGINLETPATVAINDDLGTIVDYKEFNTGKEALEYVKQEMQSEYLAGELPEINYEGDIEPSSELETQPKLEFQFEDADIVIIQA
jgi:hypothetical protein